MSVCKRRIDGGIGPYTTGTVHVLTSCFEDTILLPLGCWVFILATILLLLLLWRRRDSINDAIVRSDVEMTDPSASDAKPLNSPPNRPVSSRTHDWRKSRIFSLVLSTFLIIALLAMHALEIARLAANHEGVGLLPFCLVPLVLVLLSLYIPSPAWSKTGRSRLARPHGLAWIGLVTFWSLWMTATVGIKLWSFTKVKGFIGEAAYNGTDSKYRYSDRVLDNIVICAVYFVFLLSFACQMILEYRRRAWRAFP